MKKTLKLMTMVFILGRILLGAHFVGAQDKKNVMTTFYPVYFLTQQIAGDAVNVEMLLDGGQEAHGYESTAQDLLKVQNADLFIYQDDEMEFFVADMLEMIDQEETSVLESTKDIELLSGSGHDHGHEAESDHGHGHEAESDHGHGHEAESDHGHGHEAESDHDHGHEAESDHDHGHEAESDHDHGHEAESDHDHGHEEESDHDHGHEEESDHDHGHEKESDHGHGHEAESDHGHDHAGEAGHSHEFDPHTWLDPQVYGQQAENIKNALVELDPENKEIFEENSQKVQDELAKITQEYEEGLKDLENRTIVVQHGAFGYLTHAFDLDQVSITGLSTNEEPSAQTIAKMQEFMKESGNKVIYVDPAIKSDISKTVGEATGAELLPLRTLEIVSQEEMKKGLDYFSIMRDNLEVLKQNK